MSWGCLGKSDSEVGRACTKAVQWMTHDTPTVPKEASVVGVGLLSMGQRAVEQGVAVVGTYSGHGCVCIYTPICIHLI